MVLNGDDALEAARRVADELGERASPIPIDDMDVIHPVFRVGDVVVRLETCEDEAAIAARLDNCARMIAAGVPFVVPVTATPLRVPGFEPLVATAWEFAERLPPLDWRALGAAIAAFHDFSDFTIPVDDQPFAVRLQRAVDEHPSLNGELRARFLAMIPPLERVLAEAEWEDLPVAPSHGDPWPKNVIPRGRGRVLMCDSDFFGTRPHAFDFSVLYQATNGDERWTQLLDGYGCDAPPPAPLRAGAKAFAVNWIAYVLERRPDWTDYTEELSRDPNLAPG